MLFPERLRQLRELSGLKQKEIAKKIGVDIPMYSRYEHGERRPKREQVVKLARIYKTDPDELVALWLANSAINEIGNDKLAEKAMVFLREELGGEEANALHTQVAPVQEENPTTIPEKTYRIEIPAIDPSKRNLVKQLGNRQFPQFYEGEALKIVGRIEDESIDCIVTSPPYWSLRRYDTDGIAADQVEEYIEHIAAVMRELHRVLKPSGSLWLNMGDAYNNKALQGLPWRIALRMIDQQHWILRNDVVWDKQNSSFDSSTDHLRNVHEFIFHFVKSEDFLYNDEELRQYFNRLDKKKSSGKTSSGVTGSHYRNNILQSTALSEEEKKNAQAELDKVVAMVNQGEIPDFRMFVREFEGQVLESKSEKAKAINEKGYYFLLYNKHGAMPGDIWNILPEKSNIDRYNVFPEDLCRITILATCPQDGIVLDPYCGTGTTCKVAFDLHRRSMGIDINGNYVAMARERVQQQPLSLF